MSKQSFHFVDVYKRQRYTRERQEKNRLALTREIYEDRKKSYTTRIKAMIEYATADDKCRSQEGVAPIKAELAAIDALKDKGEIYAYIAESQKKGDVYKRQGDDGTHRPVRSFESRFGRKQ